ncbi:hypothetical protein [Bartonella apihabitans]|uniref:hypothetical protein n=1 Tax=Bartonella apihabitans TaxID=2750929 RepID=UPI00098F8C23|nr:hypothetical protein [Bartonella apihabitans]
MFSSKAHLAVKIFILEKEKGRGRNQKANIPKNRKIPEKNTVKKVCQQKKAAPYRKKLKKKLCGLLMDFWKRQHVRE